MKILIIILSLGLLHIVNGGFYDIKFETLDGSVIKTSSYQGKKVIIAVISNNAESLTLVRYLDSVQKANNAVQIIAIPTGDFNGDVKELGLKSLKKSTSIIVATPLKVKKAQGALQHPLFAWLTQSKQNQHFDMDVNSEGQLFFISAKGTLYSVLTKDTPKGIIGKVINQNFAE